MLFALALNSNNTQPQIPAWGRVWWCWTIFWSYRHVTPCQHYATIKCQTYIATQCNANNKTVFSLASAKLPGGIVQSLLCDQMQSNMNTVELQSDWLSQKQERWTKKALKCHQTLMLSLLEGGVWDKNISMLVLLHTWICMWCTGLQIDT